MKVRIKSGSQAGAVVEMSTIEAQNNIATGFAEAINEAPPEIKANPVLRAGSVSRRATARAAEVAPVEEKPKAEEAVPIVEVEPD